MGTVNGISVHLQCRETAIVCTDKAPSRWYLQKHDQLTILSCRLHRSTSLPTRLLFPPHTASMPASDQIPSSGLRNLRRIQELPALLNKPDKNPAHFRQTTPPCSVSPSHLGHPSSATRPRSRRRRAGSRHTSRLASPSWACASSCPESAPT